MDKESFEDKIRQQLERYEAPYEKSYWKKYARTYPAPRLAWWKLWWMPYLFSSLLFGGAWFWLGRDAQRLPDANSTRDTVVVKELVITRDTLVVRDTVVLVWRGDNRPQRSSGDGLRAGNEVSAGDGQQQMAAHTQQRSAKDGLRAANEGSTAEELQLKIENRPQWGAEVGLRAEVGGNAGVGQQQKGVDTLQQNAESLTPNAESTAAQMDSMEMTAIAEIATEPESKMQEAGIFFSAGPRLSILSPMDYGNFDTKFGMFAGGAMQIDWRKWQLEVGLQYGQQINEIDDLTQVPVAQLQAYPGYAALMTPPDEIGVRSSHLLMPVQLRYAVFDYRAWRIQITGGALGNVVLSELFEYYTESSDREVFNRTQAGRGGLQISHLNAGLGTSYQWRQNLELQAILNYYHPLRPLGLNRLEAGALSLQLGLNWLLLPR
jgi:hypothetical protein